MGAEPITFYIITEISAVLVMPDDTERAFTFEPPNAKEGGAYEMELQPIQVQQDFDNATFNLKKGHNKWRFVFRLKYDHHKMDPMPVALAKSVKLKVPVYLWNDSRYYQEFVCVRRSAPVTKRSSSSIYAQGVGRLSNHIPNQGEVFEFVSSTFEWNEVEDQINFLHPVTPITDTGEELTGFAIISDTEDGLGFTVKAYEPAEFQDEVNTTIKVGNKYFTIESILMESNEV